MRTGKQSESAKEGTEIFHILGCPPARISLNSRGCSRRCQLRCFHIFRTFTPDEKNLTTIIFYCLAALRNPRIWAQTVYSGQIGRLAPAEGKIALISEKLNQLSVAEELREKIFNKSARLGVLGLGYVGLPLATEFAKAGFDVTGFDLSHKKVEAFNQGYSYIKDVPDSVFTPLVKSGRMRATTDFSLIRDLDAVDICVPTPLRKTQRSRHELCRRGHPKLLPNICIPACW